jgi:tight adherence protein C
MLMTSVSVIFVRLKSLADEVEAEDRLYMDGLPKALKILWPLVLFVNYHFSSRLPSDYLQKIHAKLVSSGANYILTSDQFVATRIVASLMATSMAIFCMLTLDMTNFTVLVMIAALGYYYPMIWIGDIKARRQKSILRDLPVFLDFITLCVESGLNFTGALTQTVEKGPAGPLRHEFGLVMRDIRSGLARADALRRMESRLMIDEISALVGSVIQAEKMGASVGNTLRIQSQQRRTERFQRAEKQAMEAPVKLMGPLVMFIFPLTFIVLLFPIVMMFLQSGAL